MQPIPSRARLGVVAVAYVMVFLVAALLVYQRYMLYVNHPADVAAAGGMYAGGDLILELFIVGLLLIPTFLLVLAIRKSETAYTRYSQALLGLSLTAPLCLGVSLIPAVSQRNTLLGNLCLDRLFASPLVAVGLVVSWLMARFGRARRLASYALLFEVGTFALMAALFLFSSSSHRG